MLFLIGMLMAVPSSRVMFVIEDTQAANMSKELLAITINSTDIDFDVIVSSSSFRTMFDGFRKSKTNDYTRVIRSIPPVDFNRPLNIDILTKRATSFVDDSCGNVIVMMIKGRSSDIDNIPNVGNRTLVIMTPDGQIDSPVAKTICSNKRAIVLPARRIGDLITYLNSVNWCNVMPSGGRDVCHSVRNYSLGYCFWQEAPVTSWILVIMSCTISTAIHACIWINLTERSRMHTIRICLFNAALCLMLCIFLGFNVARLLCWEEVTVENMREVLVTSRQQHFLHGCQNQYPVFTTGNCLDAMYNGRPEYCQIGQQYCFSDVDNRFDRISSIYSDGTSVSCTGCILRKNETFWRYPADHSLRSTNEVDNLAVLIFVIVLLVFSACVDVYLFFEYVLKWLKWVGHDSTRMETLQQIQNLRNQRDMAENIPPTYEQVPQLPAYDPEDDPPGYESPKPESPLRTIEI